MMRVTTSKSAQAAVSYYVDGLSQEDYVLGDVQVRSAWFGKGTELLGLRGEVGRREFESLAMNLHPGTGEQLTARMRANRRVGFDVSFHPPKSVSILAGVLQDQSVAKAVEASSDFAMRAMERWVETRVRASGQSTDRATGNLVWAKFVHLTSRTVNGIPDPQNHVHNFVLNATYDPVEGRWKALQLGNVLKHARLFESMFLSDLARRMKGFGYEVTSDGKYWEVAGMPRDVIQRYSRRTEQVNERAKRDGVVDARERSKLGARTRERKQLGVSEESMRREWKERLSPEEYHNLGKLKGDERELTEPKDLKEAVRVAMARAFERSAVVRESALLAEVLRSCPGQMTIDYAREELKRQGVVVRTLKGEEMATSRDVLEEERRLVQLAKDGRGKYVSLPVLPRLGLTESESTAVKTVLGSRDLVTLLGVSGDRLKVLRSLSHPLELVGLMKVCGFSVTRSEAQNELKRACRVTGTVSRLLADAELQGQAAKSIWWLNDANRLSTKQAARVLGLAADLGSRVVFAWNPREKGSVLRGNVVRTLEEHARVESNTVTAVGRKFGSYRAAMTMMAEGKVLAGLEALKSLGAFKRCEHKDQVHATAVAQLASRSRGLNKAIIVTPTRAEAETLSELARGFLVKRGRIKREREFERLERSELDTMERTMAGKVKPGQVLWFGRTGSGFKFGESWTVNGETLLGERIDLKKGLKRASVSRRAAERFEVFDKKTIRIGVGDTIRITKAGRTRALIDIPLGTVSKKHTKPFRELKAGALYRVTDFTLTGHMVLSNGYILRKDYGHFEHGYAVTSSKQTVQRTEHVIYVHTADSRAAANENNLGLGLLRASRTVSVVTDGTPFKETHQEAALTGRDVVRGKAPETNIKHDLTGSLRNLAREFFGVKPASATVERLMGE
jgi:conjugative relaxase-like TrwC/TraI family protein